MPSDQAFSWETLSVWKTEALPLSYIPAVAGFSSLSTSAEHESRRPTADEYCT